MKKITLAINGIRICGNPNCSLTVKKATVVLRMKTTMYESANDAAQDFLFHRANRKVIGAMTSRSSTMIPATIPYTNTPKKGNPDSYLSEMPKTDPIDQRTNTTNSIFNDNGIGFQPFSIPLDSFIVFPNNYPHILIKFCLL